MTIATNVIPCEPRALFQRLRALCDAGCYDDALQICRVSQASPVLGTIALAWRSALDPACGLLDYDKVILKWNLRSCASFDALNTQVLALIANASFNGPERFEPVERGRKSGDLLESVLPSSALEECLIDCFTQALSASVLSINLEKAAPLAVRAWANKLEPGGLVGGHFHPYALLSAVFYPDDEGTEPLSALCFGDFPSEMQPHAVRTHRWAFQPERGDIVVFPSYLPHAVSPNTGGSVRISVAADLVGTAQ